MFLDNDFIVVTPSLDRSKLGRYRGKRGIFVIRQDDKVVLVGSSKQLYKAITRIFQKGGPLAHLDSMDFEFDILKTKGTFSVIEGVLKRYFKPKYNKRIKKVSNLSKYQKRYFKRVLNGYLEQSPIGVQAEQKGDYPESMEGNAKGDY